MFCTMFDVRPDGNVPPASDPHCEFTGKNVISMVMNYDQLAQEVEKKHGVKMSAAEAEAAVDKCLGVLFEHRNYRPRPNLDDKILTSWNGLMVSALCKAGAVMSRPDWVEAAGKAIQFIRKELALPEEGSDGKQHPCKLLRVYRQGPGSVSGFLSDYSYLIQGLLDHYEATGNWESLSWARNLQDYQDTHFLDKNHGGYFDTDGKDNTLMFEMKEDYDGAEPSANSVSVLNLARMSSIFLNDSSMYFSLADRAIRSLETNLARISVGVPYLLVALMHMVSPKQQVILSGGVDTEHMAVFRRTIAKYYLPFLHLLYADHGPGQQFLSQHNDFVKELGSGSSSSSSDDVPSKRHVTAYFCKDFACQLPTDDPAKLEQMLKEMDVSKPTKPTSSSSTLTSE
jgi:uncharacterized protein YyaL (SSP411 family)